MKYPTWILAAVLYWSISPTSTSAQADEQTAINDLIDDWHRAAARADEAAFFGAMSDRGIYIGTDQTERWTREEMRAWAKPYFSKGKAWDFKPIERQVFIGAKGKTAYFNETLETWMGTCRSSGVVEKIKKQGWKISQYHLSVTVDNDLIKGFLSLTQPIDTLARKAVIATIQDLFEGVRTGDNAKVANTFAPGAKLTTASHTRSKALRYSDGDMFASIIANKPPDQHWDEQIDHYDVRIDDQMATVWTPYTFYLNGQQTHCGVNAFHLINMADGWKIVFTTDTRRQTCQE